MLEFLSLPRPSLSMTTNLPTLEVKVPTKISAAASCSISANVYTNDPYPLWSKSRSKGHGGENEHAYRSNFEVFHVCIRKHIGVTS